MALLTRFGLRLPTPATAPPEERLLDRVAALAVAAEASGFDSLWVADRPGDVLAPGPRTALLEAHTLLGALALRTTRARLGALVSVAGWRAPSILAKQVTTLDVLSSGRAVLGLGAGMPGPEGAAVASPGAGPGGRWDELEDALRICRAMFTVPAATVEGRRHRVEGAANRPLPVQSSGPPVLVGGNGERRTLPLAVGHADACNLVGRLDILRHKAEVVERLCDQTGRDRATFTVTALVTAVVAPRPADAAARLEQHDAAWRAGEAPLVVLGDPPTVAAQLGPVLRSGIDGVVLDVPGDVEPDTVAELGRALVDAYGSGS